MATNKHELGKNQDILLSLTRAGLFPVHGEGIMVQDFSSVDWNAIYVMAQEQGVLGLVVAGLESLREKSGKNLTIPQALLLQMIGEVQMMEQRNRAMNQFIADLVGKMRAADIYTSLVKGQGVAQCYEKPLWRPSGDVDFLLSKEDYLKAKSFLLSLSSGNKHEERYSQHLGMSIGQWYVEIHGTLRTGLSARVDKEIDVAQDSVFIGGNVRPWQNGEAQVSLPAPTEDVFLVFTHFIKHFYKEGMSLRQLCDWCRLLYTYRESLDYGQLELWIRKSGLMAEWKAFYNLVSTYLGMPDLGEGLMVNDSRFDRRAAKLMVFLLGGYSGNKIKDTLQIAKIFPWKALRYSPSIFLNVNWLKVKERLLKSK